MLGDLNSDDALCRVVAEHTNSAVVNIDYPLTPEHKWPTQLDDSMKVYRWVSNPRPWLRFSLNLSFHICSRPLGTQKCLKLSWRSKSLLHHRWICRWLVSSQHCKSSRKRCGAQIWLERHRCAAACLRPPGILPARIPAHVQIIY